MYRLGSKYESEKYGAQALQTAKISQGASLEMELDVLRCLARYPDSLPNYKRQFYCMRAESDARSVEVFTLPLTRELGNDKEADRLQALITETRQLIAKVRPTPGR
jgi:hypothetical protein